MNHQLHNSTVAYPSFKNLRTVPRFVTCLTHRPHRPDTLAFYQMLRLLYTGGFSATLFSHPSQTHQYSCLQRLRNGSGFTRFTDFYVFESVFLLSFTHVTMVIV